MARMRAVGEALTERENLTRVQENRSRLLRLQESLPSGMKILVGSKGTLRPLHGSKAKTD